MNTLPNNSTRSIVNQSIEKKFKNIEEEISAIRTEVASNTTSITNHTNELSADSILIEENANDITELGVTVASLQSEIDSKQDIIEVTSDVTPNSSALVTSGGVANKLEEYYKKSDVVTTDLGRHGVSNDNRPCSAGVVYDVYSDLHEQIEDKVNKTDVVDSVILGNLNPVTSNAVKIEAQKNADEITKIKNGTEIVGKANADKDGNEITSTYATKTDLQTEIDNRITQHNEINEHLERLDESIERFISEDEKGVANGVATLDAEGRLPYSQLPESAMEFKGLWSASANTPHLEDGVGTNGDFYLCTEGGEVDFGSGSITFELNDRVIYEGNTDKWYRLNGSALTSVTSVNGKSGAVILNYNDVNALPNTTTHLSGDVPTTRKVNGKTLENDITLSASDVGALSSDTTIPTKLSELTDDSTHRLVTDSEKTSWGAKYSKPSNGIPKSDLSSDIQTSLGKADTSILYTSQSLTTAQKTQARSNIGAGTSSFSGSYNDLANKPTIPSAVTESTVSGWGFTKNTGTVTSAKMNGSTYSPSSGVVDLGYTVGNVVTASGTNTYTASLSGFKLFTGVKITVIFPNACDSLTPTLNVNNTGAKTIVQQNGDAINQYSIVNVVGAYFSWNSGTILDLYYNGTNWVIIGNPIIAKYHDSTGGYIIYADGLIEQWIEKTNTGLTEVKLKITMKTTTYAVSANIYLSSSEVAYTPQSNPYIKYTDRIKFGAYTSYQRNLWVKGY